VTASALERALSRDRLVISLVLATLTALAWTQMAWPAQGEGLAEGLLPCCGARFELVLAMWVVMMAGMMIPSVAPMVLTHAAIVRRRAAGNSPFVSSGLFLLGYLLAWSAFSALAAAAQAALYRSVLLDGHSLSVAPWLGGAILLAAGAFQLSPAKGACLAHCRSPVGYFTTEWRDGRAGAFGMGLRHGVFCIGCCWLLMAVLFAVGVMNIVWAAVLTAVVVAEKMVPSRRTVVWAGSVCCFLGAGVLFYRAAVAA
jgi:predicted metal-binding membrane protein